MDSRRALGGACPCCLGLRRSRTELSQDRAAQLELARTSELPGREEEGDSPSATPASPHPARQVAIFPGQAEGK